ncbi:MAG: tyrosine-type recombinase/integrase [Spirochaetaceae bacterium]|jgi:site-specific recombinase XerD|nr:tyrosine-type recombinase/integrase [Spirochaetaceae bacterium]
MAKEENTRISGYLRSLSALRGASERTVRAYRCDLAAFSVYCARLGIEPESAGRNELEFFIADMTLEGKAAVSVNRALSSLRGFFEYLKRQGVCERNPARDLRNKKTPKKLPVFLWEDEMADFARLPERAGILWEARDKALILLMYQGGLRISELVSLTPAMLDADLLGARVMGKGGRERRVFFLRDGKEALREYITERKALLGERAGKTALFVSMKGRALSVTGARWIIGEYAARGKSGKKIHPHSLRHSFATHLMGAGCDIRVVQELLGHKSLSSTQVYTHTTISRLKEVYRNAHPHA